jgi:A/G-specific adenine glycosylase
MSSRESSAPIIPSHRRQAIRLALIDWYDVHKRSLPWRDRPTPFRVWIAEIMAQQTRLDTVQPYFERFLTRFPDVASLAEASLDEVLALWSGLGYYGRARNLHRAARIVMERYSGQLPAEADSLVDLPGIGRYTAGAVASIAFGRAEPVLDGNVKRVLCRLFDLAEDVSLVASQKRLWLLAAELVPPDRCGDFNQALMELGALVCAPAAPACPACPLRHACWALKAGTVEHRPVKSPAREPRRVDLVAAAVFQADGRLLLVQSPPRGLFGGMWGLPLWPRDGKPAREKVPALRRILAREMGIAEWRPHRCLASFEHVLTHRRLKIHLYRTLLDEGRTVRVPGDYPRHEWLDPQGGLKDLGLPGLTVKLLDALGF